MVKRGGIRYEILHMERYRSIHLNASQRLENTFNDIEVYPDEIILYPREKTSDLAHSALAHSALAELFPKTFCQVVLL